MVSLNDDFLLGDWGDLFASEIADDCSYGLLKPKDEFKVGETFLPDLLGDADFQSADQDQDYLGQSEWMTTWTDLLHVPVDPVEEILQQAERTVVEPEVTTNTYKLSNEQERIVQEILNDSESTGCDSTLDEVPALISFEEATAEQFSPLTPPLSPDDIESILSDPSSPLSDVTSSDISCVSIDDPDWLPYKPATTPRKQTTSYTKLRPKPYDKPTTSQSKPAVPLSKKERKREQNKNAAIRYREKKRAEAEVITNEERQLEDKNKLLKNKVESMTNEISYLKDLLREVYKAKGLKLDQKLLQ